MYIYLAAVPVNMLCIFFLLSFFFGVLYNRSKSFKSHEITILHHPNFHMIEPSTKSRKYHHRLDKKYQRLLMCFIEKYVHILLIYLIGLHAYRYIHTSK